MNLYSKRRLLCSLVIWVTGACLWSSPLQAGYPVSEQNQGAAAGDQDAASADASKPPEEDSERQAVERYLRHLYGWHPKQVQVTVGPLEDSPVPSLRRVTVDATSGKARHREVVFLSRDGRYIFRGQLYPMVQDPYLANRERIDLTDQPSTGYPEAPLTVVEYSDFQCNYCQQMSKVLRVQLPQAYPDKIRLVYKDFPLAGIHPWAMRAAVAGRAIFKLRPSLFWRYHDWIFQNQPDITVENLPAKVEEFAKDNGLDPEKLQETMNAAETALEVKRSIREALELGVQSTPTLFINGRPVVGSQPFDRLKSLLDWELEYGGTATTKTEAPCASCDKE